MLQRVPNQRLRRARERFGWSQQELARRMNAVPDETGKYAAASAKLIGRWERGDANPSPFYRERLCQFFEMDAEQLGMLSAAETGSPELSAPCSEHQQPQAEVPAKRISDFSPLAPPGFLSERRWLLSGSLFALCLLALSTYGIYFVLFTDPYIQKGRLTSADSLARPNPDLNWQEGENTHRAACLFKNDAYAAFQPRDGFYHACIAQASDFRNLVFEVEMTLLSGDYTGLLFRANSHDSSGYLFELYGDGSYVIRKYRDQYIDHAALLDQGKTSAIFSQRKANIIAIVADEDNLAFYVNRQRITDLRDGHYTHGQIGLLAGSISYKPDDRSYPPAEASFRNLKIWTW